MKQSSSVVTILLAGLIAGTLDILAAIFFLGKMQAITVLRYVASGFFGKAAFSDDPAMPLYGALFHYLIAFSIAVIYFLIYPKIPFLKKSKLISAIITGSAAWLVMNLIVVPNSQIGTYPSGWESIIKNAIILMVCIGLPISIIISEYYRNKSTGIKN